MREFRLPTDRLVLRDWRGDADWKAFFRHTNTEAVMQWLGGVLDGDGMAMQRARVEACEAGHGHCFWLVERLADGGHLAGEVLGFCGLKRADAPGSSITGEMEIGWRFRSDAWGKGYAREAAEAAMDAGFTRFGAEQIHAITVIDNAASWRLMERLGMQRREDLDYQDMRYDPPWRDNIIWTMKRADWEALDSNATSGRGYD
ncbi:GNAT family N-acetyltransferase [Paraurantiacibacter namhicola]|uniref:Acetyltransferase (GNAT) family protein n=1 Tax=Paraurantiacibacter namhicola TaxID=645517 RepID=A0A1C7D5I6_9SPHN|nr:GNAT family N-acetyltransferase [Paraurantiacibacter namhicola]ANU06725.1 Acetyltransferase (GNAT) family protein [Paraurantiacibacter namhicola]